MNILSKNITKLEGLCQCPGDKSISQRIVMIGSLMQSDIKVDNFLMGADPISTPKEYDSYRCLDRSRWK